MTKNLKDQLIISLLLTMLFVLLSFFPVIQFLILSLGGALISGVKKLIDAGNSGYFFSANVIANLFPTIFLLFVYFQTAKLTTRLLSATFSIIFMIAFVFFLTGGFVENSDPYFLDFIIITLICGSVLTLVTILKHLTSKKNRNDLS